MTLLVEPDATGRPPDPFGIDSPGDDLLAPTRGERRRLGLAATGVVLALLVVTSPVSTARSMTRPMKTGTRASQTCQVVMSARLAARRPRFRLDNGKIVEAWEIADVGSLDDH